MVQGCRCPPRSGLEGSLARRDYGQSCSTGCPESRKPLVSVDGPVLDANEDVQGETCRLPKSSSKAWLVRSEIASKECIVLDAGGDRPGVVLPAMCAWGCPH